MKREFNLSDFHINEPINEPAVQYFLRLIDEGKPIPEPVLAETEDGQMVVVDGRSRLVAARRRGSTTFSAYIIDAKDNDLNELRAGLNAATRNQN